MASRVHCLKRIGDNHKKYKIILLDEKDEVTIGRNPDVTVCILSTMISRCHAVLKKTQTGGWTIKDNKSLNGVFVNDKKLEPLKPYELQDGDRVQFGVRTSPDVPPEFLYQYYTGLKVKRARKDDDMVDGLHSSEKKARTEANKAEAEQRPGSSRNVQPTSDSMVTSSQPDIDVEDNLLKGRQFSKGQASPYLKYRQKLDEQESLAAQKLVEMEKKLKEMQKLLQEKDSAKEEMEQELKEEKLRRENQVKLMADLKAKEQQLREEFEQKQAQLAREKAEMEERMREELEDMLQVKEATLLENLEKQKQALLNEKREVEERLKQELESEREKDKKLSEELEQQRKRLQKVIESKEAEQKLLESQLNDTKLEKDRKQEEVLRAREDILSNFAELMETELQCSICNELFVKATSLNCSHAFCSFCINQWMKVKKECPQCRAAITTHMRSIVLDSYIEKMVEQFSAEMKTRRKDLVEERKKEEAAFEEANRPKPAAPAERGRGRGGRGRGGRTRGGRNSGLMAAPPPALPEPPPVSIMISEDEEEDSDFDNSYHSLTDSDSDSEGSISGDEGAYFGGYGRCYSCGSRGHWANGCPFR